MRILIACEYSGVVREAFAARGHDAWSCDLLPSEIPGKHYQCDIHSMCADSWDAMIAFPPCTHLCVSGARWWPGKKQEQSESIELVRMLMSADIPMIAVENPVGILSTVIRKPDQIIQPWQFGHAEIKTTCLWLKGFPPLRPTSIIRTVREQKCWKMPPSATRGLERARTYQGIADAMADQWGSCEIVVDAPLFAECR